MLLVPFFHQTKYAIMCSCCTQ